MADTEPLRRFVEDATRAAAPAGRLNYPRALGSIIRYTFDISETDHAANPAR